MSGLIPPSEALPFARLKFIFHLLDPSTVLPAETFLNGMIKDADGTILAQDQRMSAYTKDLLQDFSRFQILETPISVLKKPSFQKNIFNECLFFGNSIFASVADKAVFVSAESPDFPQPHPHTNFVFATDGSLSQEKKPVTGGYAVVDFHGNSFSSPYQCDENTSITTLEILAIQKLLSLLSSAEESNSQVHLLIDSLSAIRLVLGLDVRTENIEILREVDRVRQILQSRGIKEVFVHVRSHRNNSVPLNTRVDRVAGVFSKSTSKEKSKCEPSCAISQCTACQWNKSVNDFVSSLNPTTKNIFQ